MTIRASLNELNIVYSSTMISTIDSGTITSQRGVGLLHLGELARPLDAVAFWQSHAAGGSATFALAPRRSPRPGHGLGRELDRQVAAVVLAIDVEAPRLVRRRSRPAAKAGCAPRAARPRRDVDRGCGRWRRDRCASHAGSRSTMSYRFSPSTICEKALPPIATCTIFLDVGHVDPVAGAGSRSMTDLQVRLADDVEHADVLDAGHRSCKVFGTLFAQLLHRGQVGTEELDRVGPLDAREGFVDVVADQLREAETARRGSPGELAGQFFFDLARVMPGRHSSIGRSGTLNSRLKKLVTSVPSSGRPMCDITPRTSGIVLMTSRSRGANRAASSRETVRGQQGANPEVSLLEFGHELGPQAGDQREA